MRQNQSSIISFAAMILCGVFTHLPVIAEQPTKAKRAAIFAGGDLTFNSFSTVTGGAVIANGDVFHGGGTLNVDSIFAGGDFSRSGPAFQNAKEDLLFGGSVNLGGPGSSIGGNINVGGNIEIEGSTEVGGNVTSGGSTTQSFTFGTINGNVDAGGDVSIAGTVGGNITHGGSIELGTFATVNGTIAMGNPVGPTPFQPLSLPPPTAFASTGADINLGTFDDLLLVPGNYGQLNFGSASSVTLTGGDYIFSGIESNFSLNQMIFDTTSGPISLFVEGSLEWDFVQVINGEALFAGNAPDPRLSREILIEVGGSYVGGSSFYGTILAPQGDITLETFASVTGQILASGDVVLGSSNVTLVPEPHSLGWLAAMSTVVRIRRSRTRRRPRDRPAADRC